MIGALDESRIKLIALSLTLFLMSGLQPARRRILVLWLWPFWQARCSGENPPLFLIYTLALCLHRISIVLL